MSVRTRVLAGLGAVLAAGTIALTAGAASAAPLHPAPVPNEAFGSVELGSPLQDVQFLAVQHGPFHGFVDYTNYAYAAPSHVWAPTLQGDQLTFTYLGTPYVHELNGGGLTEAAVSPTGLNFTGTGQYPASGPAQDAWTIAAQIRGAHVHAVIDYTTGNPGYEVTMNGFIHPDGSASGTATSNQSQSLTWTLPAGSFHTVFHFIAPVRDVKVFPHFRTAIFDFKIPATSPVLPGVKVYVTVHGGLHPAWKHGTSPSAETAYPVLAGFIDAI